MSIWVAYLRAGAEPLLGQTLPLTDPEIAVVAHTAGATLRTVDRHFERIAALLDRFQLRLVL
jgi:hypothetical protein